MRNEIRPMTKEESVETGKTFYCKVQEVIKTAENGWPEESVGEVLGTKVDIKTVDEDKLVIGSFIERRCGSERGYKRQIREEVKIANSTISSFTF